MRNTNGFFCAVLACVSLLPGMLAAADATDYPDKEIRALIGFPPGGVADLSYRGLVRVASKYLKKPLVVINRPGASQTIAMTELAGSPADGYTVAFTTDGYKSLTVHQQKVRFDPKALRMLMGYARYRHVLFVRGDSPYAKYEDFVAASRKGAGAMDYGGPGEGTAPDLIGRVFFRDLGVRATSVPFKGSNEYVAAILGGHLKSGISDISGVTREVQAGTLKLVVVFGDERLEGYPDVPSSKEKGLSDLNLLNANLSVAIHRDTPPERVAILHDAFRRAVADPEFRKLADDMGLKAQYTAPQAVEESIAKTEKVGVPLLKELNLFVE